MTALQTSSKDICWRKLDSRADPLYNNLILIFLIPSVFGKERSTAWREPFWN